MTESCEFVAGLCIHCGDGTQGDCEGWNAPEDTIKALRDRVAELEAVAKMALDALKFAYNDCESPWTQDEKIDPALESLRKAGVK